MPHLSLEDGRATRLLGEPRAAGPLAEFLEGIQPEVQQLILAYGLEPSEAEEILRGTLRTLVWKWESVRDRETWLLAVLARRCQQASALRTMGDQP